MLRKIFERMAKTQNAMKNKTLVQHSFQKLAAGYRLQSAQKNGEKMFLPDFFTFLALPSLLLCLAQSSFVYGQQQQTVDSCTVNQASSASSVIKSTKNRENQFDFPDIKLVNQNNREKLFYSDVLKDKTVVINFFYTTCNGICSTQGRHFAKLQQALGDRLGKDIFLVSITKDPINDKQSQVQAWSEKLRPKAGWDLLTGEPKVVSELVRSLIGNYSLGEEHSPSIVVIRESKNVRQRLYGLEDINLLKQTIISIVDQREASAQHQR